MNKSILITGCSSGIGYETAHALKSLGYQVFATARDPEDVRDCAAKTSTSRTSTVSTKRCTGCWSEPAISQGVPFI